MKRGMQLSVCLAVGLGAASCATTKISAEKVTAAKASVRAAEELKAENDPQGALHLQLARDELNNAESLIKKERMEKASWALERATADAELALRLGKLAQVREQAESAQQRFNRMQTDNPSGVQPPAGQPSSQPGIERSGSSGTSSPTHLGSPSPGTQEQVGEGTLQRSPSGVEGSSNSPAGDAGSDDSN